jgi:hypothetical protein
VTQRSLRVLVCAIVAVPLVGVPLVLAANEPPRFPSRDDCTRPATGDADDLEVVYGRFDNPDDAERRLGELTAVGFVGAVMRLDACGRWLVAYDAIDTLSQGEALAAQVREAGYPAGVEHGG